MWRYLSTIAVVLGLGVILFPHQPAHRSKPGPEVYSAKYETTVQASAIRTRCKAYR
jgi:thermitase